MIWRGSKQIMASKRNKQVYLVPRAAYLGTRRKEGMVQQKKAEGIFQEMGTDY